MKKFQWNKLSNVEAYYVAIFNGKDYEYFFVGNVTSWSTKGLKIWPTQEEVEAGRYKLHADGSGAELPCIPAFTYENVKDGKYKNSLLYFFRVVPANEYGQAINPKLFDAVSTVLPDAIAPNQPTSVAVSPSTYSNSKTFSVSWNGVTDFTTASTSLISNLGSGKIQYSIDGTANWTNTDKNTASGSYTFDASKLKDGEHTVYIRGRDANGNIGVARGAKFYIDRTGPAGHVVQVQPEDWSNENDVTLSIRDMKDMNSIKKIEYRIDEGEWKDTGKTTGSFAGYTVDVSSIADGEHMISIRGTDSLGNVGEEKKGAVFIDRTAPDSGSIYLDPMGWNKEDTAHLFWEDVSDATSGIAKLEYAIDGQWQDISENDADSMVLDISELSEGEHIISFRATDAAGNVSEEAETTLCRDTVAPKAKILSPADAAILDGVFEISGQVTEEHLKEWTLVAIDSNGAEKTIFSQPGNDSVDYEVQGSLDLSAYPDGENVTIVLQAEDMAGNKEEASIRVIRIGGDALLFETELLVHLPAILTEAQTSGSVAGVSGNTILYIDGKRYEEILGENFLVEGVCYQQGSIHTISAIGRDGNHLSYSQGMGGQTLCDELWESGAPIDNDTYMSPIYTSARPMLALRLDVTDFTPGTTAITYEYSIDGGQIWEKIIPGEDCLLERTATSVQFRAHFRGDGERQPQLYRMQVQGVQEFNPKQFKVQLAYEADSFTVKGPSYVTQAQNQIRYSILMMQPEITSVLCCQMGPALILAMMQPEI